MKKERPILFSTGMVQALLAGRKTQTRRIIKPQPTEDWMLNTKQFSKNGSMFDRKGKQLYWLSNPTEKGGEIKCPYGQPGDILWVRETFAFLKYGDCDPFFGYKADGIGPVDRKYKPSIHMPKAAARIYLEITDIRVERVQDISEADAKAEGVMPTDSGDSDIPGIWYKDYATDASGYGHPDHDFPIVSSPVESFTSLWESINGRESLLANPFVWAVSFTLLSTTGKPGNK